MNTEELVSRSAQFLDVLKWCTPFIFVVCVFVFIRLRVGSAGFVLHRLWALLGGKKDFVNPTLQKEASKLDDFEKIKYVTGIRFRSMASVTMTLGWLKKHEIGLEELIRVRAYFDPKDISLKLPSLKGHHFVSKMAMCLFLGSTLLVFAVSYAPAWFFVKKTGTDFWVSQDTTRMTSSDGWKLTVDECVVKKADLEKDESPSAFDQRVACELLTSEKKDETVKSAIRKQIGLAGLILLMFGIWMIGAAKSLMIAVVAADLHGRTHQVPPSE